MFDSRFADASVLKALREGQVDAIVTGDGVFILKPHMPPVAVGPVVRIFIAEDHEIVVSGIIKLLEEDSEYAIAGYTSDSRSVLEQVASTEPDIVILDISMPHISGVDLAFSIKQSYPGMKIIMYTMYDHDEYSVSVFKAGVEGFVLKSEQFTQLRRALQVVKEGGMYYSASVAAAVRKNLDEIQDKEPEQKDGLSMLSSREREVFPLLADGLSVHEIGERLFISPKTVETHKYNIFEKMGVDSVAALTKIAIREGVIDLAD